MAKNRKRRGRAEGSIFERADGRWSAEVSLGYDSHGKRVRKTVYGVDKGAVAEKLRKLQSDHDAGHLVDTEQMTVGEYLTRWLLSAKDKTEGNTFARYEQLTNQYLIPAIGRIKLTKLRRLTLRAPTRACHATHLTGRWSRRQTRASRPASSSASLSGMPFV